jgi:hypothetical protein
LGLGQPTRLLIEQRLARLGYDPGVLDGAFDTQSRRAIAQAQQDFDLPQTGFVSQDLLAALLGGLLREFFDYGCCTLCVCRLCGSSAKNSESCLCLTLCPLPMIA